MRETTDQRNRALDAKTARYNNGYQRWYNGTRPAGPNTALSGNTLLCELRYGSPAFGSAASGVATANAITQDSGADAGGTATFVRNFESDGTTAVSDMSIGLSIAAGGTGAEEVLSSKIALLLGDVVQVSSVTITDPLGT
jgi:hypothetical protein